MITEQRELMESAGDQDRLALLVPQAYELLSQALTTGNIPAAKARIALDILKAARDVAKTTEESETPLASRLAELDSAGNVRKSD